MTIGSPQGHSSCFVCRGCGRDLTDLSPLWSCPECGTTPDSAGLKDGVLTVDRPCLQCGYSLKGLEISGRCPECGGEVLRSLQGNLLIYSSSALVRKLVLGSTLIMWGLILFCVSLIGSFLAGVSRASVHPSWLHVFPTVMTVLPMLGSICSLGGWWFLSEPDPGLMGQDRMTGSRKILRITVILSAGAIAIETMTQLSGWSTSLPRLLFSRGPRTPNPFALAADLAVLTNALVWPVKTLASLQYVRAIALRIPSTSLARRAQALIRFAIAGAALLLLCIAGVFVLNIMGVATPELAPALALPVCGGAIGLLAWSCTYATLIGGLRMDLNRISRRLADRDARTSR